MIALGAVLVLAGLAVLIIEAHLATGGVLGVVGVLATAAGKRERRVKIINAEGEYQASAKRADVMGRNPSTLQLRYPRTLLEIGGSNKTSVVVPLPLDLISPLVQQHLQHGNGQLAKPGSPH